MDHETGNCAFDAGFEMTKAATFDAGSEPEMEYRLPKKKMKIKYSG